MAKANAQSVVAIDLSHLPKGLQEAVGDDVSRSVLNRVGPIRGAVIVGKLRGGIYGMIRPDIVGRSALANLNAVISQGLKK